MRYESREYHRKPIRLKDYDYSQAGAYFITICSAGRDCLFGEVEEDEMRLNEAGKIVADEWKRSAEIRREIELDEFIVMPNHIHGIVIITKPNVGATGRSPLRDDTQRRDDNDRGRSPLRSGPVPKSIGAFVAGFKSATAKRINEMRRTPGVPVWQRNYYEHIIRNEKDLSEIREYIMNNPLKWEWDEENPAKKGAI